MKKIITVVIIILVAVGLGYYLFKISPKQVETGQNQLSDFDLSGVKALTEPGAITAEDHVLGNANAKNTLISYEDFQCPYCAQASEMLAQVPTQLQDTKFVFRYYPLIQIHRNSVESAYAAEAAGAQGKYWEMHDALFKDQSNWSEVSDPMNEFVKLAQQSGVGNIDQFKNDITSKKFKDRIQRDLVESMGLKLTGTPTYYFNGKQIQTTYKMEELKNEVKDMYVK